MSSTMKYRIKVFRQYKDLILELVKRDIKLKYRRSFLGYVWSVLNPLLIMIVMTIVFSAMFNKTIENYPIYLFTGRMLFECMRNGTMGGLKSVTGNSALLKKTYIPKYVFTLAKVTSQMIETVFSLGAFFIVMFATKTPFHWQLVFLPRILIQLYIFTLGLESMLAGDDEWTLELRRGLNLFVLLSKSGFGILKLFVFVTHAMFDCIKICLHPDEDRPIASFGE